MFTQSGTNRHRRITRVLISAALLISVAACAAAPQSVTPSDEPSASTPSPAPSASPIMPANATTIDIDFVTRLTENGTGLVRDVKPTSTGTALNTASRMTVTINNATYTYNHVINPPVLIKALQ